MVIFWFIFATAVVFQVTCISVVFTKADKPSWACIVPIYGIILLCDIAGKPRWWTLLCVIPFVNVVAYIILSLGLARNFERSDGFGVGLILLPVFFYGVLAFGGSEYSPLEPGETMVAVRASPSPRMTPQRQNVTSPVPRMTPPQQKVTSSASRAGRPQQKATSAGDSVGQQRPRPARCPSCRSITFRVVEEAGSRRCSACQSLLPSYIQGNE
jgi:tryptophan-rich sensory protein